MENFVNSLPSKNNIKATYESYKPILSEIMDKIEDKLRKTIKLASNPTYKSRVKSFNSYYRKVLRLKSEEDEKNNFVELTDMMGIRVICAFLEDLSEVEQQIKNKMEQATKTTPSVSYSQQDNAMANIELDNFIYSDSNNNDIIEAGEKCQISFEVENEGDKAVTNITPILELIEQNKGIKIGNPTKISKLSAKSKATYSIPVYGTSHLKDGEVEFRAYVIDDNGNTSESREFTLPTKK